MKLEEILDAKGRTVHSIASDATLADVVRTLVEHRIGALVVVRHDAAGNNALTGIITERDILHASAAGSRPLGDVRVEEAMSSNLITGSPSDDVEQVMALMTTRRIRHLPIVVGGRLEGMISIGDIVKALLERLAVENRFLKDYIENPR